MIIEGILFSYEIIPRDRGDIALDEVNRFVAKMKDRYPELEEADIIFKPEGLKGLILVDLRGTVQKMPKEKLEEFSKTMINALREALDRGELLSISKIRIIHKIVRTDIAAIAKEAPYFAKYINDRWKIDIHTRKIIDRMETIKAVAAHISQPVDLKNPRYVLYIEVLGPALTVMYLVDKEKESETILRL